MEQNKEKIGKLMEESTQQVQELMDVNTVIGKPIITMSGAQVIPFLKVTASNVSGGGEYGDVKLLKEGIGYPFAGGNGAIVTMRPIGFLIDDGQSCRILKVTEEPIDNLIERTGEIIRDMIAK